MQNVDEKYMKEAIKQAKKAYALEETPIGCVIVYEGKIISRGYNRRNTDKNPLAHAEITAIRKASRKMGDWRLEGCTMYVTLEPCQMCADDEFIYVADSKNHCIRKITLATGYVSTLAGTAKTPGYANGPAENSTFNTPIGIAINSEGILFVNDSQNYAIRRIATE